MMQAQMLEIGDESVYNEIALLLAKEVEIYNKLKYFSGRSDQ